ncbi:MAG TPA: TonB family protein [Pyrinomonadaceae bacterium]|jgi:protein TonB|nr:TonB family protein [Pyrinomonadaceae bacterium]
MFTNLIESQSHRQEFRRRSSFFLFTVAAYAVILFGAGIASIYAYDAQLEAQTSSLELLNWVPPFAPVKPVHEDHPAVVRHNTPSGAPTDRNVSVAIRTETIAPTNDPTKVPDNVGTKGTTIPPVTGHFELGNRNVDPPATGPDKGNCLTCSTTPPIVVVPDKAPEPPVVKPPTTERVTSQVLSSKAVSLPQPPYPIIAKQAHVQGAVNIQILVSEEGKVLSAQVVNGNPMLSTAAKDAAMRARFTPTILNGQPVKIQGVITYNFVLQ